MIEDPLPRVRPDQLQEGDLVFGAKKSLMQSMLELFDDHWRHAAMVVEIDGRLGLVEVTGRNKIGVRGFDEALAFYDLVGTARPTADASCVAAAVNWVRSHARSEQLYAWDDVLMTAVLIVTRRSLPAHRLDELARAVENLSGCASEASELSRTCSAFVYEAFARAGGTCQIEVPINPVRAVTGVRRAIPELPSTLFETLTLPPAQLQPILDNASLYELVRATQSSMAAPAATTRGNANSRTSVTQFCRFARNLTVLVDQYKTNYPANDVVGLDGRWVSPTDLWRSSSVENRRFLIP